MNQLAPSDRTTITRWVNACLTLFLVMGLGFGTWLSRLPSLRDEMHASTLEMSVYGLCLAAGSLAGMFISGPIIEKIGNRQMMWSTVAVQVAALPGAVALLIAGQVPLGLASLFVYGFSFSSTDIAMNVSGANAERALGRPRLPLMHAFYSIGSVAALGIGAAAEAADVPLQVHYLAVAAVIVLCGFAVLGMVPKDEMAVRGARGEEGADGQAPVDALDTSRAVPVVESPAGDTLATVTGSIPVIPAVPATPMGSVDSVDSVDSVASTTQGAQRPAAVTQSVGARRYSPWRDHRVMLIGTITLIAGLVEGAAADWLPLALVDGRGVSNGFGAIMLGLFFGAVVIARLAGSALLMRFSRVAVLRTSLICGAVGVLVVSLVPGSVPMTIGTILWGLGAGVCWPITISAAADNPRTAVRDVAAVSAIGYASMLLGPMAFGFLGEHVGLLQAFWLLPLFSVIAVSIASVTRQQEGKS